MVLGVGTDIVKIERIKKACTKKSFVHKCFTEREIALLGGEALRGASAAGFFAAKEAVSKALGTGFSGFGPTAIEVLKDERNKPFIVLHGQAAQIASEKGMKQIFVSISHEMEYAIGYAIAEGEWYESGIGKSNEAD